jgi:hypothetical protein
MLRKQRAFKINFVIFAVLLAGCSAVHAYGVAGWWRIPLLAEWLQILMDIGFELKVKN